MQAISFRIFLLRNLVNSILLYFVPKTLLSWFSRPLPSTVTPHPSPASDQKESMDFAELEKVFQTFDRNGDGRITQKELNESLENLGIFIPKEELSTMIQKIDANNDGCVDVTEFGALYQSIMAGEEDGEEEDMKEAFNVFDQNGDGFISCDELKAVLDSLGLKQGRTAEDCKVMIMKVDVDGDGRVNYNEFKQMMKGGSASLNALC